VFSAIELIRGRCETRSARIGAVGFAELAICSGVWADRLLGAHLSNRGVATVRASLEPFALLPLFPFDRVAAEQYAEIRAYLQPAGRHIGKRDMQIAAIARARDLTLVTDNTKEFSCLPLLRMEDRENGRLVFYLVTPQERLCKYSP
jgi:tRNA(fMet)-specific endonuclease VapC